jgi:glutamate N-acetyltransferase/amino-acid N-acetyltransferase
MSGESEFFSSGSITSPRGFVAGATCAGLKTGKEKQLDLALLFSEAPCAAAGVFTTNQIKAAPVLLSRQHLRRRRARAIVVNSGCANACTGEQGLQAAAEMASWAARRLGISPEEVLVASTGVIGMPLPLELVRAGIDNITLSPQGGDQFARAILTTDTFPKQMAVRLNIGGELITIGGVAKGAGMIHPNLATLLCFLTTDAAVEASFLERALRQAVDVSFNMLTLDGDTSTNDTVLLLANGSAGGETIEAGTPEAEAFQQALQETCLRLTKDIARDGEGATRRITVCVAGAATPNQAKSAARAIAGSSLVKAAVHGSDPNWGRILAALGRSGAEVVESKVDLYLDHLCLMRQGCPQPFDKAEARGLLSQKDVVIRVCLNLGEGEATAWGCDLSEEYVSINSAYTT